MQKDRYEAVLSFFSFFHLRHTVGDELGQSTDLDLGESRPEFALHQVYWWYKHRILMNSNRRNLVTIRKGRRDVEKK